MYIYIPVWAMALIGVTLILMTFFSWIKYRNAAQHYDYLVSIHASLRELSYAIRRCRETMVGGILGLIALGILIALVTHNVSVPAVFHK